MKTGDKTCFHGDIIRLCRKKMSTNKKVPPSAVRGSSVGSWGDGNEAVGEGISQSKTKGICRSFQVGHCARGDSCKFLHSNLAPEVPRSTNTSAGASAATWRNSTRPSVAPSVDPPGIVDVSAVSQPAPLAKISETSREKEAKPEKPRQRSSAPPGIVDVSAVSQPAPLAKISETSREKEAKPEKVKHRKPIPQTENTVPKVSRSKDYIEQDDQKNATFVERSMKSDDLGDLIETIDINRGDSNNSAAIPFKVDLSDRKNNNSNVMLGESIRRGDSSGFY